jgi:hypothetical protein
MAEQAGRAQLPPSGGVDTADRRDYVAGGNPLGV